MNSRDIERKLLEMANEEKAVILRRFFKTGPGQYGEGDIFLGITVPQLRKFTRECVKTSLDECMKLLKSPVHEHRLLALFLLIRTYAQGNMRVQERIFKLYLKHTRYVNNWDLVDLSAPHIIGNHLHDKQRHILYHLAESNSLWERRISIIATLHFIRKKDFADTLRISEILVSDEHDLIQKAVGWMLREVGKRDIKREQQFLARYYRHMPRTMLRYAIERFPERLRKRYLNGSAPVR